MECHQCFLRWNIPNEINYRPFNTAKPAFLSHSQAAIALGTKIRIRFNVRSQMHTPSRYPESHSISDPHRSYDRKWEFVVKTCMWRHVSSIWAGCSDLGTRLAQDPSSYCKCTGTSPHFPASSQLHSYIDFPLKMHTDTQAWPNRFSLSNVTPTKCKTMFFFRCKRNFRSADVFLKQEVSMDAVALN